MENPKSMMVFASDLIINESTTKNRKKTKSTSCLVVIEAVLLIYKFETVEHVSHFEKNKGSYSYSKCG